MARINEVKGLTEQQMSVDEFCEREEALLEQEAIEHYREENYPASRGKYPEITLSEEVIKDASKEK